MLKRRKTLPSEHHPADQHQKRFLNRWASLFFPRFRARVRRMFSSTPDLQTEEYARRRQQEMQRFAGETKIHDLPPIFHYWSNKFLRPVFESFGFSHPEDFYALHIADRCLHAGKVHILSIGAGNCDTEVRVGRLLADRGIHNWTMTCLDLVPEMLKRGAANASGAGLSDHFHFVAADFNHWSGTRGEFDVVMANQCLHHVVELERLFDHIPMVTRPDGIFMTSDMIGRNGHVRWPEAKALVDRFWQELPPSYRYNQQLRRQEELLLDWDCSVEGFEGIRSQDILPLLCERFGFKFFLGFGNVIDPFVDRSFGWNFNAEGDWDKSFIDRVHAADEEALESRAITPTHMLAVMTTDRSTKPILWQGRSPQEAIRIP